MASDLERETKESTSSDIPDRPFSEALERYRDTVSMTKHGQKFEIRRIERWLGKSADEPADPLCFISLQDGRAQALKIYYSEAIENQYGEMVKALKGVADEVSVLVTRLHEWTVRKKGAGSLEDDEVGPWTRVNNCTRPSFGLGNQRTGSGGGGQYVSSG